MIGSSFQFTPNQNFSLTPAQKQQLIADLMKMGQSTFKVQLQHANFYPENWPPESPQTFRAAWRDSRYVRRWVWQWRRRTSEPAHRLGVGWDWGPREAAGQRWFSCLLFVNPGLGELIVGLSMADEPLPEGEARPCV